jgi:chitinase
VVLDALFFRRAVTAFLVTSAWVVFSFPVHADLWSTAYYAGWMQGTLPASNVDFTAVSHVIHFSVVPNANGSLNSSVNSLTTANSTDVVTRAHAAGRKVLFCVGGADSQTGFQGATSAANLSTFVTNLVNFMVARGYDGIDLDWEPLPSTDFPQYTNLVNSLRTALNGFAPARLLTAAVGAYPVYGDSPTGQYTMFAALQAKFDQLNIMTYDLSGAYSGWITWFNAPTYDGGTRFISTGALVPSTDGAVSKFLAGGVAPGKLGIGLAFYGYVWSGGAGTSTGGAALPRQSWTTAPTTTAPSYDTLMTTYYQPQLYHWDTNAQAAYLSLDNAGSANDKFISYDDEHACQAKVSYARNRGLGGVMIWELGSGYRPGQPAGQRDPLLQAVKQSLATPRIVSVQSSKQDLQLDFTSLPLALYRVQWTSNFPAGDWNTLTNNVPGTNGTLRIIDPGALTNAPARYYRVQTPP